MIETGTKSVQGTPVFSIYEDSPETKSGEVTIFVPGTKMNVVRKVEGDSLQLRAAAAKIVVAGAIGDFIMNAPMLGNPVAKVSCVNGEFLYPSAVEETTDTQKEPEADDAEIPAGME